MPSSNIITYCQMNPEVSTILQQLNVKSLEQLISFQQLNPQTIAKSTQLHPMIVQQLLFRLSQLLSRKKQRRQTIANLSTFFEGWCQEKQRPSISLCEQTIVQIIGRCGKSTLLIHLLIQSIKKNYKVIFLDGSHNCDKLWHKISQMKDEYFKKKCLESIKCMKFKSLSDLAMLIHALGNKILSQNQTKYLLFIDSFSLVEKYQNQVSMYLECKTIDKFTKLLEEYASKINSIVYTFHTPSNFTLFQTQYNLEKQRPKPTYTCAKLWDAVADQTLCIDYASTLKHTQILKIMSTKGTDSKLYTFQKPLKI